MSYLNKVKLSCIGYVVLVDYPLHFKAASKWRTAMDQDGETYYFHIETKQTTWNRPVDYVDTSMATTQQPATPATTQPSQMSLSVKTPIFDGTLFLETST
jgi:hypothetical protein